MCPLCNGKLKETGKVSEDIRTTECDTCGATFYSWKMEAKIKVGYNELEVEGIEKTTTGKSRG